MSVCGEMRHGRRMCPKRAKNSCQFLFDTESSVMRKAKRFEIGRLWFWRVGWRVKTGMSADDRLNVPRNSLAMASSADKTSRDVPSNVFGTFSRSRQGSASHHGDASGRIQLQFSIRHLFAFMFVVTVCLSPSQGGLIAIPFVVVPGIVIGLDFARNQRFPSSVSRSSQKLWLTFATVLGCAILGAYATIKHGKPEPGAWCVLIGNCLWCVVIARKLRFSVACGVIVFPVMVQIYISNPFIGNGPTRYIDVRTARRGVAPFPGAIFSRSTRNTELLENYLSHPGPVWNPSNQPDAMDLINDAAFAKYLDVLPNDNARTTVCMAITDRDNLLRFHQEMLLVGIGLFGYPREKTRDEWWKEYCAVFLPEYDAAAAVRKSRGWLHEFRLAISSDGWQRTPSAEADSITILARIYAVRRIESGPIGPPYDAFWAAVMRDPTWQLNLNEGEKIITWTAPFGDSRDAR